MGLFSGKSIFKRNENEKMWERDGYTFGDSGTIYHVPDRRVYKLPEGTKKISLNAITEMRNSKPYCIIVPGSFKKFGAELLGFDELKTIELQEGVEEVKCIYNEKKYAVDVKLPSTIKKIGAHNYPVVQYLVLPNGVVEIEKLFASHDTNLIYVNIPGTLKVIPFGAFNQCRNLRSVIINEGVETSMEKVFYGTNKLCTLVLPSTYNGTIKLPMESRDGSNIRGNSKYDVKGFADEQKQILNIKIKRENKSFEFNIKRGEQPTIEIKQNSIKIKCVSWQQEIVIDCMELHPGIYDIENGTIKIHQSQDYQEKTISQNTNKMQNSQKGLEQEEMMDELDIIFQKAYRDNITNRSDFLEFSGAIKMQIKKEMKVLFFQIVEQFGTINTGEEMFDYLYNRVLNETEFEEEITSNDFGRNGKKR